MMSIEIVETPFLPPHGWDDCQLASEHPILITKGLTASVKNQERVGIAQLAAPPQRSEQWAS